MKEKTTQTKKQVENPVNTVRTHRFISYSTVDGWIYTSKEACIACNVEFNKK